MKLLEALEVLKQPVPDEAPSVGIFLLCGFTPLHLRTLLAARLGLDVPGHRIEVRTGLYGDLAGSLETLRPPRGSVMCVAVEWPDLDPRLGIRSLGSWRSGDIADIVESARRQSERLVRLIRRIGEFGPVYASAPTLPLPPIFVTRSIQAHHDECKLREIAASMPATLSAGGRVKLVSSQRLDELSPFGRRFDPKAEIRTGFPYSLEHASTLAQLFAGLVTEVRPRKGLITDLDETLWAGILGEVGVDRIAWDMASGAHVHGLYQKFLASLASAGVLLAVASKNDRALVDRALLREDILLPKDTFFPVEASWGRKSEAVARILKIWNIAADDVVFVDDSPMELAEVKTAFPRMECMKFLKSDVMAFWELLRDLRERFGKSEVSTEDGIRLLSIRESAALRATGHDTGLDADGFMREAQATIRFSFNADPQDNRAFELVNKTNQFNLNGRRWTRSEWLNMLQDPKSFLLTATYEDKYGPLGKIAVVMGKNERSSLCLRCWVMSCRAFSRRIEHQCLKYLFEHTGAEEIVFEYAETSRNAPIGNFLTDLLGGAPSPRPSLSKTGFEAGAPVLFHRIVQDDGA